jgi:hypothetical protein
VIEVRAVGPGLLEVGDQRRFQALGNHVFLEPTTGRLASFGTDASGQIIGFADSWSSPGTSYERLDARLLEEVQGESWREQPSTQLQILYLRQRGDWQAIADCCDAALESPAPSEISHTMTLLMACEAYAHLGDVGAIEERADRANELLETLSLADRIRPQLNATVLVLEAGAWCVQEEDELALSLLEDAVADYGSVAIDAIEEHLDGGLFDSLRDGPARESLAALLDEHR